MKQSFLNIGRLFSKDKTKERKAYTTIKKLPIAIWWEITDTGEYSLLIQEGEFSPMELYHIYMDLLQEYIDNFSTNEKHKAFIEARHNYALKLARYVATQDSYDHMLLQMAEIDMNELKPKNNDDEKTQSLGDAMAEIEETYGERDENTLSTYKFFSYRKRIREKIEAQKKVFK